MKYKYHYELKLLGGQKIYYPDYKTMKKQLYPGEELVKICKGLYHIITPKARMMLIGFAEQVKVK